MKHLAIAEFAYNNSRYASLGVTPFFALMGRHPRMEDHVPPPRDCDTMPEPKARAESLAEMRLELEAC